MIRRECQKDNDILMRIGGRSLPEAVRLLNDSYAALAQQSPDRLTAFVSLPLRGRAGLTPVASTGCGSVLGAAQWVGRSERTCPRGATVP
jgi:hypothetical protein